MLNITDRLSVPGRILLTTVTLLTALIIQSCDIDFFSGTSKREPTCIHRDKNRIPLFGDTHVHTHLSFDARSQGTIATHDDAYAFARGERIGITPFDESGNPLRTFQLDRPLDFVAISDHAEFLGAVEACFDRDSRAYDDMLCQILRETGGGADTIGAFGITLALGPENAKYPALCGPDSNECIVRGTRIWSEIVNKANNAQDHTENCTFTAFPAYEWTGTPFGQNLHRNVIFKNEVVPERPHSYLDAPWVEDLWTGLRQSCLDANNNCDVLTIPHNSNISGELMFKNEMQNGAPFNNAYMEERQMMEPLIEIYQHKGNSECISGDPIIDPNCDFELVDYVDFFDSVLGGNGRPDGKNFIRYALNEGLKFKEVNGINPFKYGIIASTDTHLAIPGAADERRFPGHGGAGQANTSSTNSEEVIAGLVDSPYNSAGGLAGVWAEQNSRNAIFDAMKRRETFGTSGPRISVRFFGGWDFPADICQAPDAITVGYHSGVPMGGDLPMANKGQKPTFFVSANQAAATPNRPAVPLHSIQIVKGWINASGQPQTGVFDIEGQPITNISAPYDHCSFPTEGHTEICRYWQDESFNPSQQAYYYARVLEPQTCRWTTHACLERGYNCKNPSSEIDKACCDPILGLNRDICTDDLDCNNTSNLTSTQAQCCKQQVQPLIQERAWTSPIWYVPK